MYVDFTIDTGNRHQLCVKRNINIMHPNRFTDVSHDNGVYNLTINLSHTYLCLICIVVNVGSSLEVLQHLLGVIRHDLYVGHV